MRASAAYLRLDGWYFHSSRQTTVGIWLASTPYLKLPLDAGHASLGDAVRKTLDASFGVVPHPENPIAVSVELPEFAGTSAWDEFERNAKRVRIEATESTLTMIPMAQCQDEGGFEPIVDTKVTLNTASSTEAIGKALKHAIELCR